MDTGKRDQSSFQHPPHRGLPGGTNARATARSATQTAARPASVRIQSDPEIAAGYDTVWGWY